jgi:hypothetical protein
MRHALLENNKIARMKRTARLAAIGVALGGTSLFTLPANAEFIATIVQDGPNIVVTGSGTFDLTDLTVLGNPAPQVAEMYPGEGILFVGPPGQVDETEYTGANSSQGFGPGLPTYMYNDTVTGSGDLAGGGTREGWIDVPQGYISGDYLSDSTTYYNETFSTAGINPGVYTETWGSGPDADSFVIDVETPVPVPEPSSALLFAFPLAMLGFVMRGRSPHK